MAASAISSASSAGMAISGGLGTAARTVVSNASRAGTAIKGAASTAKDGFDKVSQGVNKANELKGKAEDLKGKAEDLKEKANQAVETVGKLTGKVDEQEQKQVEKVITEVAAGKPVEVPKKSFLQRLNPFNRSPGFGRRKMNRRKMTKRQAMDLIKRLSGRR
jgi:hypothetical protein